MKAWLLAGSLMLTSCAWSSRDAQTIEVEVNFDGGRCGLLMAGDEFSNVATLLPAVQESGAKRVRLIANESVPYRCVGGLVFELQRVGIEVTFAAQPPQG